MEGKKDIITVAAVNFKTSTGNKVHNLSRMEGFSVAAAKRGADLVLFPEMCLMGYDYFVDEKIKREDKVAGAETVAGPACTALSAIAQKYGIYIVFGAAEKEEGSEVLYNSAFVLGPDGYRGAYRKIHPFETESTWCTKGDDPFLFDTEWGLISVGICFDTYQFPELMRYYASKGSRLYLNPTAVIEEIPKEGSRQAFINYYAPTLEYGVLCNTIFIASANLTGFDDTSYFGGGSAIIGPKINAFFETDMTYYAGNKDDVQEGIALATLDLSLATRPLFKDSQYTGKPDYRPEIYKKFI